MNMNPKTDHESTVSERFDALSRTCFVIMPFGKKNVGGKEVDFNAIYKNIFEPAIRNVETPENQMLIPERTDMDAFSGLFTEDLCRQKN